MDAEDAPSPEELAQQAARQEAEQQISHQADVLRHGVFAALMTSALSLKPDFDPKAFRLYLGQLVEDAGNPTDPIERMLIEQLGLAHFRIALLQVGASEVKTNEGVKIHNAAAARMLGEFRRTALALRAYRSHVPEKQSVKNVKIHKMAQ